MSNTNFHIVTSPDHFKEILSVDLKRVSLINFWASWAEPCKQMNNVVEELAKKHPELLVLQVEAEEQEDISESFEVQSVPSIILLRGHTLLDKISGADARAVTVSVDTHLGTRAQFDGHATENEESEEELGTRMRRIMQQSPVVLFMKGDPTNPRCGFSSKAVALLREQQVAFTHFDILGDEAVRQGLKKVNDWPTFPQFIVKGEFVGGLDVITEMVSSGEFADVFGTA
ncbi:thioredoxin-like protein [Butyriboletus roseoflavus]|nr:thioredoxin-like protein [Butyriboletus roseoflavus]